MLLQYTFDITVPIYMIYMPHNWVGIKCGLTHADLRTADHYGIKCGLVFCEPCKRWHI